MFEINNNYKETSSGSNVVNDHTFKSVLEDFKNYSYNKKFKKVEPAYNFGKCSVCSDRATGIHYGVPSCEGCKGFFKRSLERNEEYVCYYGYNCEITPKLRKRCKYCRWQACLRGGMTVDSIRMGRLSRDERVKIIKDNINRSNEEQQEEQQQQKSPKSSSEKTEIVESNVQTKQLQRSRTFHRSLLKSVNLHISNYFPDVDITSLRQPENQSELLLLSILRDKCYQLYLDCNFEFNKIHYERALSIIKKKELNEPIEYNKNLTMKKFWELFLAALQKNINTSINYVRKIPGFNLLKDDDFKQAVIDRVFMIITTRVAKLFIDGEFYLFVSDDVYFAKEIMDQAYGKELADEYFEFFQKFNDLKLTDQEIAVFIPSIITSFDSYESGDVYNLNMYYKKLLSYELSLSKRSEDFIEKLKAVFEMLSDACKRNRDIDLKI